LRWSAPLYLGEYRRKLNKHLAIGGRSVDPVIGGHDALTALGAPPEQLVCIFSRPADPV
jgi:hypothetical protein